MNQRPLGVCSVCGNYAYKAEEVGGHCHAHHHGQACNGIVRDAGGESDWQACPACVGRGYEQEVDCPQCAGTGWLPSA